MNVKTSKIQIALIAILVAFLFGCAHPISVTPSEVARSSEMLEKIKSRVGVYISPESLELEVTTPGGGGDSVRYFPYRDIEVAFYKMLENIFEDVVKVTKIDDSINNQRSKISYIASPEILTNSGATTLFGWAPTNFSVDLTTNIRDVSGNTLYNPRVIGVGSASVDLGIGVNRGIAGQLAMKDALQKTQIIIYETLYQKTTNQNKNVDVIQPSANKVLSIEERMSSLKILRDKNLITSEDYELKKSEILKGL